MHYLVLHRLPCTAELVHSLVLSLLHFCSDPGQHDLQARLDQGMIEQAREAAARHMLMLESSANASEQHLKAKKTAKRQIIRALLHNGGHGGGSSGGGGGRKAGNSRTPQRSSRSTAPTSSCIIRGC